MPRYNITPEALRQAETNPAAFEDAEDEVLSLGLEKLGLSLSPEQVSEMVARHKEVHELFERRERANAILRIARRNRRGPLRDEVKEFIRRAVEADAPAHWVSHLRQWEAELGE